MKEEGHFSFLVPLLFTILCSVFTICVRLVDRQPAGPAGSVVGFAAFNGAVHELIGVHLVLYRITQVLGMAPLILALFFAYTGIRQLIEGKGLTAVDVRILLLGLLYAVQLLLYLFFEKAVVNFRPVLLPGESSPAPSFPSSHTMLACTVLCSAPTAWRRLLKRYRRQRPLLDRACFALAFLIVAGRFFSGVHWATDIIGGLLFSATLVAFYRTAVRTVLDRQRRLLRRRVRVRGRRR